MRIPNRGSRVRFHFWNMTFPLWGFCLWEATQVNNNNNKMNRCGSRESILHPYFLGSNSIRLSLCIRNSHGLSTKGSNDCSLPTMQRHGFKKLIGRFSWQLSCLIPCTLVLLLEKFCSPLWDCVIFFLMDINCHLLAQQSQKILASICVVVSTPLNCVLS